MRAPLLLAVTALAWAGEPVEVMLWPNGAPGSEGKTAPETLVNQDGGVRRIAGIHKPSLTVYLPDAAKATGAGAIILPGGGHRYLSIDNEGHAVARWLSERGVAGFVLKYRLAREEGSTYKVEEHALADAQRALRLVRTRAEQYRVKPDRVGVIGFSAGGQVAALAAARFDLGNHAAADPVEHQSSMPSFQGLIYSGGLPAGTEIPKNAPPAFLCVAFDDRGPAATALPLVQKMRDAGVSAELHLYSKGGHGFGMRERPLAVTGWAARFHEWLGDQALLQK